MKKNQNKRKIKMVYIVMSVLIVISILELALLIKPNKKQSNQTKFNFDEELKLGDILFDSNNVKYDNTISGLTSSTVQDAIDELNASVSTCTTNLSTCQASLPQMCLSSPFHVGDYIDMTPTSTSFTPDRTITGLDEYDTFRGNTQGTTTITGILNPSYLNVWRVININSDCTVEVVSEYVSDVNVKFASKVGYQNYVYYINEIAKQYANATYTLNPSTAPDGAFRNIGYNGQTKQITNTTRLNDTTLGTETGAWYQKPSPIDGEESLGGGDQKYITDLKLLDDAGVSLVTYAKGSTVTTSLKDYWLAGREYVNSMAGVWYFGAHYITIDGNNTINSLLDYTIATGEFRANTYNHAIRPIVTLKSGLTISSGNGTSSSHYQLSAN